MAYLELLGTACAFAWYSWKEEREVRRKFYSDPPFKRADAALKKLYRLQNPYAISRRFLKSRGASDIHTYGETPLTSLELIVLRAGLCNEDVFLDLGCGRGRGVFFVHCRFGCRAVGIDWVPHFVEGAKQAAAEVQCPVEFICDDMAGHKVLSQATVIYLAWTCLDEHERSSLEEALEQAKAGTKVITVSYPLSSKNFIQKDCITVSFPWGEGEVFFHERKNAILS